MLNDVDYLWWSMPKYMKGYRYIHITYCNLLSSNVALKCRSYIPHAPCTLYTVLCFGYGQFHSCKRHQMETVSASPVTDGFLSQRAELWCFLWSAPKQTVEQTIETLLIWDAIALFMTSLQYHILQRCVTGTGAIVWLPVKQPWRVWANI